MCHQLKATIVALMLSVGIATTASSTSPLGNIDDKTITWHLFEAPPLIITQGTHKNRGIVDGVRTLLQNRMTTYTHRELPLPYKRFLIYAKQGLNICTPYLFKTSERAEYLYFSDPAIIFPGFGAIMHKDTYAKIGSPSEVSITDFFANQKFHLVTNKIRSYGPNIDPIIKLYENKGGITRHVGSTTSVFRLLTTGRADFMIDFPNRILYWSDELGIDAADYVSIPIKEEKKNAISYIACPKTDWGKSIIEHTNKILKDVIAQGEYLSILKRWSPVSHQAEIEDLYNRYLLPASSGSKVID